MGLILTNLSGFLRLPPVNPKPLELVPSEVSEVKVTRRRKITPADIEKMGELLSKRVTETGACLILGIKPATWWQWKERHATKFEELLTGIKETQILAHMENIERAQVKDWRASRELLAMKAPERFSNNANSQQSTVIIGDSGMLQQALKRVFSDTRQPERPIIQAPKEPSGESSGAPAIDV